MTSQVKGYPFEVAIPKSEDVSGVILSDQVKSLDWQVRKVDLITKLSNEIIDEVIKKLKALLP